MSAIYGIFRFDGAVADQRALDRMGAALKHRATHDHASDVVGAAGLGVCLGHVTREDAFDVQPVVDAASRVTLVADCRLDNRSELAAALGIAADTLATMPDSVLILRAYLKWGQDCPAHLLGDFVFALWDGTIKRLFLARDHMGQRDLNYHIGDGFLAFAPEAKALWTLPEVPRELSDDLVARRLMHDRTPGQKRGPVGIEPLIGGSTLSIGLDGIATVKTYWEPTADPQHLGRDEAYYISAYRRVLGEAVACRLARLIDPPGLQFSGGYDSGGIAALAGETLRTSGRKLVCASSTMPSDYQGTIRHAGKWVDLCARDMPWIDLRRITREGIDALTDLDRVMNERQSGPNNYGFVHEALFAELASAGVRQMMDGHGGDYTLNPRARGALARFLKKGQLLRLAREWRAHRRATGQTVRSVIALDILPHLAPALLPSTWRERRERSDPWKDQPVQRAFAEEMVAKGVVDLSGLRVAKRDATAMRARLSEMLDRVRRGGGGVAASYHGLTLTRPFHDKRVVELALAIPEDLFLKDGRNRYLACRALADLYPPEFQQRSRKNDDEIPDFQQMVSRIKPQLLAEITRMEQSDSLTRMIDFGKIRDLLNARGPEDHNSGWEEETQLALGGVLFARYLEWFRRTNS